MRNSSPFSDIIEHLANQPHPFDLVFALVLSAFVVANLAQWISFGVVQASFSLMSFFRYLFVLRQAQNYFY